VRFLIDMPVTPRSVQHLVTAGHDAVHAAGIGLAEASHPEILQV
jgi:predicted nuclease of predicted toxin-antitoxin system